MKTDKTYPIEVNIGDKCFKLINKMTREVQIPPATRRKKAIKRYFWWSAYGI